MTSREPRRNIQEVSKKRCYVSEVAKLLSCSVLSVSLIAFASICHCASRELAIKETHSITNTTGWDRIFDRIYRRKSDI